jgi:hypothetical protein
MVATMRAPTGDLVRLREHLQEPAVLRRARPAAMALAFYCRGAHFHRSSEGAAVEHPSCGPRS